MSRHQVVRAGDDAFGPRQIIPTSGQRAVGKGRITLSGISEGRQQPIRRFAPQEIQWSPEDEQLPLPSSREAPATGRGRQQRRTAPPPVTNGHAYHDDYAEDLAPPLRLRQQQGAKGSVGQRNIAPAMSMRAIHHDDGFDAYEDRQPMPQRRQQLAPDEYDDRRAAPQRRPVTAIFPNQNGSSLRLQAVAINEREQQRELKVRQLRQQPAFEEEHMQKPAIARTDVEPLRQPRGASDGKGSKGGKGRPASMPFITTTTQTLSERFSAYS